VNRAELLKALRTRRAEWEALLRQVDPAKMDLPLLSEGWTVKDAVAHITYYESVTAERLTALLHGQAAPPAPELQDNPTVDALNAWIYAQNRERPVEDVMAESWQTFHWLVDAVQGFTDERLQDHALATLVQVWPDDEPLWKSIAFNSFEHYEDHQEDVKRLIAG
jgi:hypothetical protein